MTELKPCPFCGGKAKFLGAYPHRVYCTNCFCTLPNHDAPGDGISENAKAWNTRAELECEMLPSDPEPTMALGEGERCVACSICGEKVYILPDSVMNHCIGCGAKVVRVNG